MKPFSIADKIKILQAMNENLINANDGNEDTYLYDIWACYISNGTYDVCFENFVSIAKDEASWIEACKIFSILIDKIKKENSKPLK